MKEQNLLSHDKKRTITTILNVLEKELKQKVQTLTDNPIMMMVNSGARGSIGQYNQMAGMRGLLAK